MLNKPKCIHQWGFNSENICPICGFNKPVSDKGCITKDKEHFEERFSELEKISEKAKNIEDKDWEEEFDKKFATNVELTKQEDGCGGSWINLEKDSHLLKDIKQFISKNFISKKKLEEWVEKNTKYYDEFGKITFAIDLLNFINKN